MAVSSSRTTIEALQWSTDGYHISGHLHLPARSQPPVVIGSHGLLADSSSPKQLALAEACNHAGLAYLRFDHRGCGQSTGELPEVTTLEARCSDLRSALHLLRQRADLAERFALFGSSFGGTVSLAVAAESEAMPLVTFAAPIRHHTIRRPPPGSLPHNLHLEFDITAALPRVSHIHVFHGEDDALVPMANALELFSLAGDPKRLTRQKGGDHRMTHPKHQQAFVRDAVAWFATMLNG